MYSSRSIRVVITSTRGVVGFSPFLTTACSADYLAESSLFSRFTRRIIISFSGAGRTGQTPTVSYRVAAVIQFCKVFFFFYKRLGHIKRVRTRGTGRPRKKKKSQLQSFAGSFDRVSEFVDNGVIVRRRIHAIRIYAIISGYADGTRETVRTGIVF